MEETDTRNLDLHMVWQIYCNNFYNFPHIWVFDFLNFFKVNAI